MTFQLSTNMENELSQEQMAIARIKILEAEVSKIVENNNKKFAEIVKNFKALEKIEPISENDIIKFK